MAVEHNCHVDIVRALLGASAKVNEKDDDGYTPLMAAVRTNRHVDIVQVLLDAGGVSDDIIQPTEKSALKLAIEYQRLQMFGLIMSESTLDGHDYVVLRGIIADNFRLNDLNTYNAFITAVDHDESTADIGQKKYQLKVNGGAWRRRLRRKSRRVRRGRRRSRRR